jgi:hypothetical protein
MSIGCVEVEDDDLDPGTTVEESRIRNNLPENAISKFAAELDVLVTARLGDASTRTELQNLHGEPTGRRLLDFLVRCSLKQGTRIKLDGEYFPLVASPQLGLAPAWSSRGLSDTEERWMISCLLAHINTRNNSVALSACGGHSALPCTASELTGLDSEAVFFGRPGELGNPDEEGRTFLYVAPAPGLLRACGMAQALAYLEGRECSRGSCEDLKLLAPAEPVSSGAAHVCDPLLSQYPYHYGKCASQSTTGPKITITAPDKVYTTAITTWMDLKTCPLGGT